jgi:hypothetical protein
MYHEPLFSKTKAGQLRWKLFCNNRRNREIAEIIRREERCRTCKNHIGRTIMERERGYLCDYRSEYVDEHKLYLAEFVRTYEPIVLSGNFSNRLQHLKQLAAHVCELSDYVGGFCCTICEEMSQKR